MLEKGVFEPVPASSKLPGTAIPSFMFVKEKAHLMDPSTSYRGGWWREATSRSANLRERYRRPVLSSRPS